MQQTKTKRSVSEDKSQNRIMNTDKQSCRMSTRKVPCHYYLAAQGQQVTSQTAKCSVFGANMPNNGNLIYFYYQKNKHLSEDQRTQFK